MKQIDVTPGQQLTMAKVNAYLASKGVPKAMVRQIQLALVYDALTQGHDMKYDRIYTAIALMLRKELHFGVDRITRCLHAFDDICGSVLESEDDKDWTDIMQELKDETGIVVRTDESNRVFFEIDTK